VIDELLVGVGNAHRACSSLVCDFVSSLALPYDSECTLFRVRFLEIKLGMVCLVVGYLASFYPPVFV
jgi:hypothetical protein